MNQGVVEDVRLDVLSSLKAGLAGSAGRTAVPASEAGRVAALDHLMLLDTAPEAEYDDLVTLASAICQTPIALVSLIHHERQWFKAKVGMAVDETHRDVAFCAHAIQEPHQLFVVPDATVDARFANNPLVMDGLAIRFYAGAPIVTDDGYALGTVCVIDTKPRTLTVTQERALKALARQAAGLLSLRKASVAVAHAAKNQAAMTAEARLKQEQGMELLDLVLQGRGLGLWDLDVTSGKWTASAQEFELLGYAGSETEVADLPWHALIHPDDRAATTATMGPHLRGETPFCECTHRMRHRTGRWLWILSRAIVVRRDAAGVPTRIVGTHVDITETRRLEAERLRNAERLELALLGGDIGIWDVDVPTGKVVYNEHWANVLGYTLAELERQPDLWKSLVHPQDGKAFQDGMARHLRGELPMIEGEGRLRHKDGHWIWVLLRAKVFERDAAGRPLRIVGANMNITSRKVSEIALADEMARRRVLLDHASEYVFVLSKNLRLTEANQSFAKALGYTIDAVMQLQPWEWDAVHDTREKFRARWTEWQAGAWTAELQWRRRDGTVLDVEISCTSLAFTSEEEFLFVCRDITDRKRDRLALERTRNLLEQTAQLARVGGWEVDLVAGTVTWSSEVYRIHEVEAGWHPDLASGIAFYAEEARPVIAAAVQAAIADGTTYDLQLPLVTAKGRRVWVRTQGHAEYEDGRAVRLVGVFQDITDRKAAEDALIDSERRLRLITDHMPASIMHIDRAERYRFVNRHFGRAFGITPETIVGLQMRDLCSAATYQELAPQVAKALAGQPTNFEWSAAMRDGERQYFQSSYVPDIAADGHVVGFYALIMDITGRKQAELKSVESEKLLRGITDNLPACIAEVDRDGRYRFANATYLTWTGTDPVAMIGRTVEQVTRPEYYKFREVPLARALTGERVSFEQTITILQRERTLHTTYLPHFDELNEVAGLYALTSDITELKETQRKLDALARMDALTGLPNRRHFEERAAETLARTRRTGRWSALFYLDVDRFKAINDTLGHAGGDELLTQFAARLGASLRETDFVARYAGDEFVAIAEGLSGEAEAGALADKIAAAIRRPFSLSNACIRVTTSIGIATFDGDSTLQELLARADGALYEAKAAGRDGIRVSHPQVAPQLGDGERPPASERLAQIG